MFSAYHFCLKSTSKYIFPSILPTRERRSDDEDQVMKSFRCYLVLFHLYTVWVRAVVQNPSLLSQMCWSIQINILQPAFLNLRAKYDAVSNRWGLWKAGRVLVTFLKVKHCKSQFMACGFSLQRFVFVMFCSTAVPFDLDFVFMVKTKAGRFSAEHISEDIDALKRNKSKVV